MNSASGNPAYQTDIDLYLYLTQDEGLHLSRSALKPCMKLLENYEHISFLEELLYLSET